VNSQVKRGYGLVVETEEKGTNMKFLVSSKAAYLVTYEM
jgi:hypothetical protein